MERTDEIWHELLRVIPTWPAPQSVPDKQPVKRSLHIMSSDESALAVSSFRASSSSSLLHSPGEVERLLLGSPPNTRTVGMQHVETPKRRTVGKQHVEKTPDRTTTSAYSHLMDGIPSPPLPGEAQKQFRGM